MGQLIDLAAARAGRARIAAARADRASVARAPAAFFFALDCPISYLVGERVERVLGEIDWLPVLPAQELGSGSLPAAGRRQEPRKRLALAAREAQSLRLPLVEPDRYPLPDLRPVARAALFAAERGAARAFALAAARLAFCGGFDLADPDTIADAAHAAALAPDEALAAAQDLSYDGVLEATTRGVLARAGVESPAIALGGRWFAGIDALLGASRFAASRVPYVAVLHPAG